MKKHLYKILILSSLFIFTQCELFNSNTEEPLTLNSLINQNQKFPLEPEKNFDLENPDSQESFVDNTPGILTTNQGQSYVTQWNVTRKHYSAISNPDEFVLYNPNASVLWPGNLIQGASMISGTLDPVPVSSRKPITVYCTTVTGGLFSGSQLVENPAGSSVTQAINEIMSEVGSTSAKFQYSKQEVFSSEQMRFNFEGGYSNATTSLDTSLGIDWSEEKQRVVIKLTQQYFSMAIDNPAGWNAVLGDDVSASYLQNYTSASNPLVYIDSVTYGRVFMLVYESLNSSFDLDAELSIAFDGIAVSADATASNAYNRVMQNAEVKCFAMGGNATEALAAANNLSALNEYLQNGATTNSESFGVPISYTLRYLKDATLVKMNNTLEYFVDEKTPITSNPLNSDITLALNSLVLEGYDGSGYNVDLYDITLKMSHYNFDTSQFQTIYNEEITSYKVLSGHSPFTQNLSDTLEFQVPKRPTSRIRIEITGWEDDGSGDTYFQNHQRTGTSNILEISYDLRQNSWTNSTNAAPQLRAIADDPDDSGEWISADLSYTLSIQDAIPESP